MNNLFTLLVLLILSQLEYSELEALRHMEENGMSYVTVYEVTRHYGGPEEGGWWYNWYSFICSTPVTSLKQLNSEKHRLTELYSDLEFGDIYSVNGGLLIQTMIEETPGEFATEKIPYYC